MPKSCESGGDDLLKWWERAVCCLDAFGWEERRMARFWGRHFRPCQVGRRQLKKALDAGQ